MDIITLALAKKYVQEILAGAGGIKGDDGKSAYQIALDNGFSGTEYEWLESLQGPAGSDGITPAIGENGNWYLGTTDTGKPSRGEKGDKGTDGYTPVKGTDYFTESDKAELVNAVLMAMPVAEGVSY